MQHLTDSANQPRKCDLCPIRLAEIEVQLVGYSIFLCSACEEARQERIAENERSREKIRQTT